MQPNQQIFLLIGSQRKTSQHIIGGGFILPDGQVAIARSLPYPSHATFPCLTSFQQLQDKRGRSLIFGQNSLDGYHLQSFNLVRTKDVTGISGIGIVAIGCYFQSFGDIAVMQWLTPPTSTAWYTGGQEQIELIHGHKGKTHIVMDLI